MVCSWQQSRIQSHTYTGRSKQYHALLDCGLYPYEDLYSLAAFASSCTVVFATIKDDQNRTIVSTLLKEESEILTKGV